MRKLTYIFGIALFLFGCGANNLILNVSYDNIDYPQKFFTPKDKRPVLYIEPVVDNRKFAVKQELLLGAFIKSGRFEEDPMLLYQHGAAVSSFYRTSCKTTLPYCCCLLVPYNSCYRVGHPSN